ncbi:F0F1 ATP synthase subunit A [uncultured Tyzzerella sp.]|uniref:F0F1 ATP synthase subunit A n=1 Tax=uncultured Tyzzerella sp. TaxID=2321398 RepID=UPI0029434391|nr:F0F1 ATP synthase subunit A [uncultured Tyzzerella sp.]
MDFGTSIITKIGGVNITQTMMNTWIIIIFLTILALIIRAKINKFTDVPTTKLQNIVELIIETMENFTIQNMGEKYKYFGNWFFGVFCFILVSNYIGLLSFRSPTADLGTTLALSLATFTIIHFMGIKVNGGGYFKGYIEPMPLLLPLNIIGEIATPISLSLRLFGNILGGTIIMGLINSSLQKGHILLQVVGFGAVTPVLHAYFDVFAGFLQTFIFVILSMTFIKDKIGD